MALTICSDSSGGAAVRILGVNNAGPFRPCLPLRRHALFHSSPITLHVTSAKSSISEQDVRQQEPEERLTTKEQEEDQNQDQRTPEVRDSSKIENVALGVNFDGSASAADGSALPELPGLQPDFWEGPQWDVLGFFVQYLWAFGLVFALIACGIAVATYDEGATDFKETPAYKESIQYRELLEEPEASNSDVFESNPTEVAPSLE
ncbi:hypothetical protein SLE2022_296680 [Rubroshorea leprosula]